MRLLRALLRGLLVLAVVAAGVAALVTLVRARPEPTKQPVEDRGALVEVVSVSPSREQLRVEAHGTVVAARKVVLQPEVTGRVVWQSKELLPGGRFKRGQAMLSIDARDYSLAARQHEASVDRAQLELQLERSRKSIAQQEWEIIGEEANAPEEGRALALREPQLKVAEATVESAKSARAQAQLALGRTSISAPFNGFIQSENVDVGQLVSPASQLAVLVGTDAFWVQVSVPVEQVAWVDVPGLNVGKSEGSLATVWQEIGAERRERPGRVIRLLGDLDPIGRMARLLVQIDDPMALPTASTPAPKSQPKSQPPAAATPEGASAPADLPLLLGAYVGVVVQAGEMDHVVEIPRLALREGDKVYLCGPDQKLIVRKVEIVWRREQTVLVRAGLTTGDELITSRLPSPVPGMLLRKTQAAGSKALGQR